MRSIQTKLFAVVFALTTTFTAFFTTFFPAQQIASERRILKEKTEAYARLVSREVEGGIAFDDRETVREVFSATAQDPDVRTLALYTASGELVERFGEPLRSPDAVVSATAEVFSRDRAPGRLVIELSTDALERESRRIELLALEVGLAALAVGLLTAWAVGRKLARRLGALVNASRDVAIGDLSGNRIEDDSADEVGQLAQSFNTMVENLTELVSRFDVVVDQRTAQIKLILDHMNQGLVIVTEDGSMSAEHSQTLADWLGKPQPQAKLWDYLAKIDPQFSLVLQMGWDMVRDKDLPIEFAIDALPKTLRHGSQHLAIEYRPIQAEDELVNLLVVFTDITSRIERERADAAQRELLAAFERISKDRVGFMEFFDETDQFLENLGVTPLSPAFQRALHTLKGNSHLFGLTTIGDLCHTLETAITETGKLPDVSELVAAWHETKNRLAPLVGGARSTRIELDEEDYTSLVQAIPSKSREELLRIVAPWRLEPASRRLERIAEQARSVAFRLGKSDVRVITRASGVRLDPQRWSPFWSAFVHVLRNAIDHGIETREERTLLGKPTYGLLSIQAYRRDGSLIIEAADDGRGIDWQELAERGRAAGLVASTQAELEELLFRDGITTRIEADETSGRGLGLGAVRDACAALGGTVHVESSPSEGTALRFVFPATAA